MSFKPRGPDLVLWTAAGVQLPPINDYLTLVNATTYYAEIACAEGGLLSVFWSWAAALVAAITYESTNLPLTDATVFVAAGNLWFPETGPGTLSPNAAASCSTQHFSNFCARRMRAKVVVTTGGAGQLRGRVHGKGA